jgi:hypothetical protein
MTKQIANDVDLLERRLSISALVIEANRWPENEDVQQAIASAKRRIESLSAYKPERPDHD